MQKEFAFLLEVPKGQVVKREKLAEMLRRDKGKKLLFDLLFTQGGMHGGGEWGKSVLSNLVQNVPGDEQVTIYVAMNPAMGLDKPLQQQLFSATHKVKIIPVNVIDDIKQLVNYDLFDIFFTPAIVVYTHNYSYLKQAGGSLHFDLQHTKVVAPLLDIRDLDLAEDFEKIFAHRKRLGCRYENHLEPKDWLTLLESQAKYRQSLKAMYKGIIEDPAIQVIITLSNYCKGNMEQALDLSSEHTEKIQVLYPEMKIKSQPKEFAGPINFSVAKFILVGNIGRKEKNGAAVVKALDELAEDELFKDYYFVLTGIRHLDELDLDISHRKKFIHFHFLAPGHLEFLYQKAKCLVFASLNEGFGLPPLEAMVYDTPCVVSNVTALPEIYGEGVVYCDPYRVSSVKAAIRRALLLPPPMETRREVYQKITRRQLRDSALLMELIMHVEQIKTKQQ